MASHLPAAARQRAIDFIKTHGTNLHMERYLYHFEDGNPGNVIAALGHYQNPDGGFGRGLEADLRTRNSSVVATTVALQMVDEVGGHESALARDAMRYLTDHYKDGNWALINENCNDAPHAPWWKYDRATYEKCAGFRANPGAEILSYLISFCALGKSTRAELLDRALTHIAMQQLEMHELLCYLRLYENPKLPEDAKQTLLPHLLTQSYQLVKASPCDWEEYCLTPIDVVTSPESPLADFFGEALDANIAHRIARQSDDGAWSPAWSWGNAYPEAWREAEREIKVDLTLRFLVQLDRFGRLDWN